jgi:hypothetical protein
MLKTFESPKKEFGCSQRSMRGGLVLARRIFMSSLAIGIVSGVLVSTAAPVSSAAATSQDKTLFVAVGNSYNDAVVEFNLIVDSFTACPSAACVSAAIEGVGDTNFYKSTLVLDKLGPYPSGISKDVNTYVGNLITIQKDINSVAKAKTIPRQKAIVQGTLELDVDNLAFRGIHIEIYLGEQRKF